MCCACKESVCIAEAPQDFAAMKGMYNGLCFNASSVEWCCAHIKSLCEADVSAGTGACVSGN